MNAQGSQPTQNFDHGPNSHSLTMLSRNKASPNSHIHHLP